MGSSTGNGSGGGGGGNDKKDKKVTGTTKPGTSGGFKAVKGSSNLKQATTPAKKTGGGGKSKTAADIGKELDKLLAAGPAPAPTPKKVSELMNKPMSPAQSMAMAGNTGLAGISEAQANTIVEANKQINKIFGDSRPETFESLGQEFGEVGSKYRRPADKEKYAQEVSTIAEGLAAGATPFIGPDGVERIGFTNLGMKDEEGRTILSKQLPGVTAQAPTLGQVGGDISRAITGYDSLVYPPSTMQGPMPAAFPSRNVPYMQTTPGIAQGLAKLAVPGSVALGLIQDLYGKGKDFLFGEEEEDEFESLVPRDITIEELVTTPVSETGDVPQVIDFSGQGQGGGGGGGATTPTTPEEPPAEETETALTDYQKLLQQYAQLAGFAPERVESIVRQYGANGGLMNLTRTVAPDRGPMSAGVASLFKNK